MRIPSFVWYIIGAIVAAATSIVLNHFKTISWLNTGIRKTIALIVLVLVSTGIYVLQSPAPDHIEPRVDLSDGAAVDMCADVTVEASVEEGQELWLAYRGVGYGTYFMRPVLASPIADNQRRVRLTVGNGRDGGVIYEFHAIIIDKRWADWLRSLRNPAALGTSLLSRGTPLYVATGLPPSVERSDVVRVTRNPGEMRC